jgi:hypothetical protein
MLEFYKTFAVPRLEARVRVRQAHSHQLNSIEQRQLSEVIHEHETLQFPALLADHPEAVELHTEPLYSTVVE